MSENNSINSFIITNGLVSRLSGSDTGLQLNQRNGIDKKNQTSSKSMRDQNTDSNGTLSAQKKPLRRLNSANCEIQTDAAILKIIPQLFERFIEVVDSATEESCHMMMCKACRFLLKKNADALSSHLCKQKDIDKFSSTPIINNQLIFRSKPKNRATPIWNEFEEVIEPTSNLLLGYARCKRCFEIIKTSDPKSIPAVLRRHVPLCPCGPFPSRLLITTNKSTSENNHSGCISNRKNSTGNHSTNSSPSSKEADLNSSVDNNMNTSAHNLSSFIKELSSSNSLLNVMKNLTNNQNNLTAGLNLSGGGGNNSSPIFFMPLVNNLSNNLLNNSSPATNVTPKRDYNSSSKVNHLKNEYRDHCIELCYKELVGLETLRSPTFKRLCQTLMQLGSQSSNLSQLPQLPDASQLYNQVYTKYSTLKFKLKNDLQLGMCKSAGGALVCDSQDDLCILATYYISNEWKLKETVLSADAYGNDINNFITSTLNDYRLNEEDKLSKFTFVSRGGHFDGVNLSLISIAHTVDHIINNTIFFDDTYTDIIENCRLVCNELNIEVKLESIVENVDWVAKYEIMRHVLINIDQYELRNYPLNFDIIRFLVDLLTPFRNASEELRNCSKHPTLNHVLLWYYKIIRHLEEGTGADVVLETDENDDEIDDELDDLTFMKKTKKSVHDAVYEFFELHSLHRIAVFLWPNFRSLKMLSAEERSKVHEETRKLIETRIVLSEEDGMEQNDSYKLESNSKKARTDFADWEESSPVLDQDELQRYLNETLPICDEDTILNWWKDHQAKFPKLAKLAKWILSIPASVTLIEKFRLHKNTKVDEEILYLHCNLFDK